MNCGTVQVMSESHGMSPSSETPEASRFGPFLRSLRSRAGLTQRELADRSGVSLAAVRDLEQGRSRRPRRASIRGLAVALGLSGEDESSFFAAALGLAEPAPERGDDPNGPVAIAVLGALTVTRGGVPVPLTSAKQKRLLLRLALSANETVGRDELLDLLWDGKRPASAANLLHTYVGRLRRLLEPGSDRTLVTEPGGYKLAAPPARIDVERFRELAARASAAPEPREALEHYAEAAGLWRGETDVDALRDGPLMAALTGEYAVLLRDYACAARELGEGEAVLPRLRDLAARLELDENLHAELIMCLAAAGRRAEALDAYERIRSSLAEQLGIDPGTRLRQARRAVLDRTRTESEPSTEASRVVMQTPAAPADFVGRVRELDRITGSLRDRSASAKIVALCGSPGVGKTALALRAALRLREDFPDGQLYCDLRGAAESPLTPLEVLGRFLRALGVRGRRVPASEAEAAAMLRSELSDRRMLMVLDNARDSRQVEPLLPGTGDCAALITSRRRLADLPGAEFIDLPTLPYGEALELLDAAAGTQSVTAEPQAARELATACGQLPLALRIAGSRLAVRSAWTAADLARRLRDRDRRLTELRVGDASVLASFQLSYQDLSEQARRAFRLSAVHPGDDFGLEAAAVLLGLDPAEADLILQELLDASLLIQYTSDRFRLHDLLGLYAAKLLDEDEPAGFADDRDRYYDWCLRTVTAAMEWVYPQLVRWSTSESPESVFASQEAAMDWLDLEAPALVALIERLSGTGHSRLAWQIADQLRGYFLFHRQAERWLRATEAGLRAANVDDDPSARAAMHMSRGQAMWSLGRHQDAIESYTEAARWADEGRWWNAAAYLRHNIGLVLSEQGRLGEAEQSFQRALELSEHDEFGHVRAVTFNGLGAMCIDQGRLREAVEYLTAALRINLKTGREKSMLANRNNLGMVLHARIERAADLAGRRRCVRAGRVGPGIHRAGAAPAEGPHRADGRRGARGLGHAPAGPDAQSPGVSGRRRRDRRRERGRRPRHRRGGPAAGAAGRGGRRCGRRHRTAVRARRARHRRRGTPGAHRHRAPLDRRGRGLPGHGPPPVRSPRCGRGVAGREPPRPQLDARHRRRRRPRDRPPGGVLAAAPPVGARTRRRARHRRGSPRATYSRSAAGRVRRAGGHRRRRGRAHRVRRPRRPAHRPPRRRTDPGRHPHRRRAHRRDPGARRRRHRPAPARPDLAGRRRRHRRARRPLPAMAAPPDRKTMSHDESPRLRAESLSVAYGPRAVLDGVDLDVPDRAVTAIVGPNGCGKSTLLRAMGRVLAPRSGAVLLDGEPVHRRSTRALAHELGLLPQTNAVPEQLTVADLVARGRYPHRGAFGRWTRADREAIEEAVAATGLRDLADRTVDELSGGQRQRAWIAMTLAQRTPILLLDEPTTYLDLAHRLEVLRLLRTLNAERGVTVVMVLHDLHEAARYADHLIAMREGQIVADGAPGEVVTPRLVEEVFGVPCAVTPDPVSGAPLVIPLEADPDSESAATAAE